MKPKIVHAKLNESGYVSGGKAGDQTGNEVVMETMYSFEWQTVLRPLDKELADKIVENAKLAAQNENIGYDQPTRYSMYEQAKKHNFDFSKIDIPCATDCSQLVATVLIASGVNVSPYIYTWTMIDAITKTGKFAAFNYTSYADLRPGDILVTVVKGHTVIVVEADTSESEYSPEPKWVGEAYGVPLMDVHSRPSYDSIPITGYPRLAAGNLFDVCDAVVVDGTVWFYIRIAGKYYGWLEKDRVLRKTPNTKGITTGSVYLRTNPGKEFKALAVIPAKEELDILDSKPASTGVDWYYVIYNGLIGFCSSRYVKLK